MEFTELRLQAEEQEERWRSWQEKMPQRPLTRFLKNIQKQNSENLICLKEVQMGRMPMVS